MDKFIKIFLGLILFAAPVYAWITNVYGLGSAAEVFLKGGLMWILIFVGLMVLIAGISELKE